MSSTLQDGPKPISLCTSDGRVTVNFVWRDDRFIHQFLIDGRVVDQAGSVDQQGDQDWPSSPPLQQLSAEVIDGRPVILGIGLAGTSHWSVVVQAIDTVGGQAIKFEWACRHKAKPSFLGTTYGVNAALSVLADGNARLTRSEEETLVITPTTTTESGTDCWSYRIESAPVESA